MISYNVYLPPNAKKDVEKRLPFIDKPGQSLKLNKDYPNRFFYSSFTFSFRLESQSFSSSNAQKQDLYLLQWRGLENNNKAQTISGSWEEILRTLEKIGLNLKKHHINHFNEELQVLLDERLEK